MNEKISTKFSFSKSIAWQIEPNEDFVYVLDNKTKKWFFLDDVSKDIWLQIAKNKTLDDIVKTLIKEYEIDYQILYDDIKDYIYKLQEEGLVNFNE